MNSKIRLLLFVVGAFLVLAPLPASADHAWGDYHWARETRTFALALGDNLSSDWDAYLATASSDWSQSKILDTAVVAGGANSPQSCHPTLGRVEVCNGNHGNSGWLGLASIWIAPDHHIVQGRTQMNDYYFAYAF